MAEIVACARHPSVETGLRCVQCETAICPQCAQDAVVGMRCPACAKPDRGGGLRRRPGQIRKAAIAGVLAAAVGAVVLGVLAIYVRFFQIFAAFIAGMLIGRRVREAASGNTVDVIRTIGMVAAAVAVLGADFVVIPLLGRAVGLSLYTLLQLAAAVYAANRELQ